MYCLCCSVKTDVAAGGALSRLFIANARTVDSGNYTCALADLAESTVAVHVLNGKSCWGFGCRVCGGGGGVWYVKSCPSGSAAAAVMRLTGLFQPCVRFGVVSSLKV